MRQQTNEFKNDSYVIDVLPPGKTTLYPTIEICRRKKKRQRGKLALDKATEQFPKISSGHDFDPPNIDETARRIGRAILDDSPIIRDWRANRP